MLFFPGILIAVLSSSGARSHVYAAAVGYCTDSSYTSYNCPEDNCAYTVCIMMVDRQLLLSGTVVTRFVVCFVIVRRIKRIVWARMHPAFSEQPTGVTQRLHAALE